MMELMNDLGLELNEKRRREVALDTMRAAHAAKFGGTAWIDVASDEPVQPSPAPKLVPANADCAEEGLAQAA